MEFKIYLSFYQCEGFSGSLNSLVSDNIFLSLWLVRKKKCQNSSVAINVAVNLKKDHKNNIFIPFARIEGVECSHVVLKVCIDEFKSKSVFSKFLLTLPG